MRFKKALKEAEVGIEEFLVLLIVFLTIVDFFHLLTEDFLATATFLKLGASYFVIGYLFYKAELTKIFFGHRRRNWEIVLITSYFFMSLKYLIAYMKVTQVATWLIPLFTFVGDNALRIEMNAFLIGGVALIGLSIVFSRWHFYSPGVMRTIHASINPAHLGHNIGRFFTVFFVLLTFFIGVFDILLDWSAFVMDAPLVFIGILGYMLVWVKHHKKFNSATFIYKVGNLGDELYDKLVQLFHYQRTIMIGVFGILSLHIVTDVFTFIVPYVFGVGKTIYFPYMEGARQSLSVLLTADLQIVGGGLAKTGLVLLYGLNVMGLLSLMVLPAYIGYCMYKHQKFRMHRAALFLFYISVTALFLAPVFHMGRIDSATIYGVDILTNRLFDYDLVVPIMISALIMGAVMLLAPKGFVKVARRIAMIITEIFFGLYLYLFVLDASVYYSQAVMALAQAGEWFFSIYLFLFFGLTLFFYVGGYTAYVINSFDSPIW